MENVISTGQKKGFSLDTERIRNVARRDIAAGAVTPEYSIDRGKVLELLEGALATEWVCVLRYTQHYLAAQGIHAAAVAAEFLEHAGQEQAHAMKLGQRIKQLGGTPHLFPHSLAEKSHADYVECDTLEEMIKENLVAERIAVETYREMIRFLGHDDPTTRRLLEEILEEEEEHADDLADFLVGMDHASGGTRPSASTGT